MFNFCVHKTWTVDFFLVARPRPCPEKEWVKEDLEPVNHALFL
jgi:hypothetical protein